MAGILLTEYQNQIKPRLERSIDVALAYMADKLVDRLIESATKNVYESYTPSPYFDAKRRYELENGNNYKARDGAGEHSIEIENTTVTQGGYSGEVNWVETGFRQGRAGARPFMEEGLTEYVSRDAEHDLMFALESMGF